MQRKHLVAIRRVVTERHCISIDLFFIVCQSVDCGSYKLYLCVCVCVCPAFMAYISLTMDRILIKLSENVGTLVQLFVLKFHCDKPLGLCAMREMRNGSKG